jgi:hypothetical protein
VGAGRGYGYGSGVRIRVGGTGTGRGYGYGSGVPNFSASEDTTLFNFRTPLPCHTTMDALALASATLLLAPLQLPSTADRFTALLRVSTACPMAVLRDMITYVCDEDRVAAFIDATVFPADAVAPCHELVLRGYSLPVLTAALRNLTWRIDTNDGALQAAVCFSSPVVVRTLLSIGGYPWHGNVPRTALLTHPNAVPISLALSVARKDVLVVLLEAARWDVSNPGTTSKKDALFDLLYHGLQVAVCHAARDNNLDLLDVLIPAWKQCPFKVVMEDDCAEALVQECAAADMGKVLRVLVSSGIVPLTERVCWSLMHNGVSISQLFLSNPQLRREIMVAQARARIKARETVAIPNTASIPMPLSLTAAAVAAVHVNPLAFGSTASV